MNLNPQDFTVYDVSNFPIVMSNNAAVVPGYAPRWEKELTALVRHGQPMVLVFVPPRNEESQEDRKHRGMWLKQNKEELASVCRALISVETDPQELLAAKEQAAGLVKAFGVPIEAVATLEEAIALGHVLTAGKA